MKNEILEVCGSKWLVRDAVSREEAENAIDFARVRGSVGNKNCLNDAVLADVTRLPSFDIEEATGFDCDDPTGKNPFNHNLIR